MMKFKTILLFFAALLLAGSCKVSYKFNGASIDYSKVKTVSIADFPNQSALVYPPLSQNLSEAIRDIFSRQTRLQQVKRGGDLHLEGEIIGYALQPLSVGTDALAAETRLTITVRLRFSDSSKPGEDVEQTFSANRTFSSSYTLNDVQEDLCKQMVEEIVDNIFNATVANW